MSATFQVRLLPSYGKVCLRTRVRGHTGRDASLGDTHFFELFGDITSLFKVDVFDIFSVEIVFTIGERLDLVEHDVIDVQPRS